MSSDSQFSNAPSLNKRLPEEFAHISDNSPPPSAVMQVPSPPRDGLSKQEIREFKVLKAKKLEGTLTVENTSRLKELRQLRRDLRLRDGI